MCVTCKFSRKVKKYSVLAQGVDFLHVFVDIMFLIYGILTNAIVCIFENVTRARKNVRINNSSHTHRDYHLLFRVIVRDFDKFVA